MSSSRIILLPRSRLVARPSPFRLNAPRTRLQQHLRFQSTASSSPASSSTTANTASPALIGALSGALAAVTTGYIFYRTSGTRDLVAASKTTKAYISSATERVKQGVTPDTKPSEALDWLRNTATSYAAFVPGAKGYVEKVFQDIDKVREGHGEEVDKIVRETYEELKGVLGEGDVSVYTATEAWKVLVTQFGKLAEIGKDAAGDVLDEHPEIKKKLGGNVDKLRKMGEEYGPEAKKEVEKTWAQVKNVLQGGLSKENIEKAQKLVKEKVGQMQEYADSAWQKGLEKAQPLLDKNPKVKKLIDENKDALKSGNYQELWDKVQSAVKNGDTKDLEKYIQSAKDKAKDSGLDIEGLRDYAGQFVSQLPGGDKIMPKLEELQEAANKHGDEAQKLFKDALEEVSQVLGKYAEKTKGLASEAKKDVKK